MNLFLKHFSKSLSTTLVKVMDVVVNTAVLLGGIEKLCQLMVCDETNDKFLPFGELEPQRDPNVIIGKDYLVTFNSLMLQR